MLDLYYSDANSRVFYRHVSTSLDPYYSNFHLHNGFEIYFFISGSVNYFVEKKVYPLKYGDLLIMNNNEIHKPSFLDNSVYERIVIHFDPSIPQLFNTNTYSLLDCFINRPTGEKNKISLTDKQKDDILKIYKRIETQNGEVSEESKILKLTAFIELLVFINKVFKKNIAPNENLNMPKSFLPILDFIDNNLEEDLSLKRIESLFFINATYLSRVFKKYTGSNLHEYIMYKRISRSKKLMTEGYSCTEACLKSGFNDYSNFSRLFKKTVGQSPRTFKNKTLK